MNDNFKLFLFLFIAFAFIASSFYFGESHKPDRYPASVSSEKQMKPMKDDNPKMVIDEWNNETKYGEKY